MTGGNQRTPVSHPVAGVVTVVSNGNTVNGAGHRNGSCGGLVIQSLPYTGGNPGAGSARSDRREPASLASLRTPVSQWWLVLRSSPQIVARSGASVAGSRFPPLAVLLGSSVGGGPVTQVP